MMKADTIYKIEQSVKVDRWNHDFQFEKVQSKKQFFNKYAQGNKQIINHEDSSDHKYLQEELNDKSIESGFRKLKNQQIQKLKDLKFQYEQIRKITTDYAAPKGSKTPSMSSSHSQSQIVSSPKNNKRLSSGKQVQILELEKKQLEIMVENSMKKIEELLHNELEYKKTIHELRLQREVKHHGSQNEEQLVIKSYKRRQKDNIEKLKSLQLEKQSNLSSLNAFRDKVKYLQGHLNTSQQELKKTLQEKRNSEELLRVEKDKFLTLEIEFKRVKRQHEILQKDKNAEINRLLKLKDVKQSSSERELKALTSSLQEQLKIKQERYSLLLEKFESYQKERLREQKEAQVRIVNDILTKSQNNEPQNKLLQETLGHILGRLTTLQSKPVEIDSPVKSQEDQNFYVNHQLTIKKYQNDISVLSQQLQEKNRLISSYEIQIHDLTLAVQEKQRQRTRLSEIQYSLLEELEKVKKNQKVLKKQIQNLNTQNQINNKSSQYQLISNQNQVSNISASEKTQLMNRKQSLQKQNQELRLKISRLEFQVRKAQEESELNANILKESFKTDIENRQRYESTIMNENNKLKIQINSLKDMLDARPRTNQTTTNNMNNNGNLNLSELVKQIQALRLQNQSLRNQSQNFNAIVIQNQKLTEMLRRTRVINGETDLLWQAKEQQYQRIYELLQRCRVQGKRQSLYA